MLLNIIVKFYSEKIALVLCVPTLSLKNSIYQVLHTLDQILLNILYNTGSRLLQHLPENVLLLLYSPLAELNIKIHFVDALL